jgi:hypothetical protein
LQKVEVGFFLTLKEIFFGTYNLKLSILQFLSTFQLLNLFIVISSIVEKSFVDFAIHKIISGLIFSILE